MKIQNICTIIKLSISRYIWGLVKGVTQMSNRAFYYDDMSYVVSEAFQETFGREIEFVERGSDYGQFGRFWLTFYLKSKGITITFLSEKDMISILLKDPEGAMTTLAGMCVYGNELCEENIISAVQVLKRLLAEYEPVFAEDHGKNVVLKSRGVRSIVSAAEYRRMVTAHECKIHGSNKIVAMMKRA